jgi:hypothetical protein
MTAEIHVGETPTFRRTIKDQDGSVVSISGASAIKLIFKPPSGSEIIQDATLTTDGNDGKMEYDQILASAGRWSWQGYVKIGTKEWYTNERFFTVYGNLATVP